MHLTAVKHFLTTHRFYCSIGLIIGVALFLRGWQFGSLPGSLYFEEPALGYDAYSIFKTGKDMHGNAFPIVAFPSFGDYKPSGYFYLAAPFVGIWGMNEVTVRLPSLILGLVAVAMVMALSQGLFRHRTTTLLSGLALAVMPTAVHLSRAAFEVNAAVGLLSMALAGLVWAKKFPKLLLASVLPLAASMYTYHSLRLVAPLLYLLTFFTICDARQLLRQKLTWLSVGLFLMLISPIVVAIQTPQVAHRYQEVAFFPYYSQAVEITNELRATHGNTLISRLLYHRYWIQIAEFSSNIFKHFSPDYLLVHGDGNLRHQDTAKGIIYWWMVLVLILGIGSTMKQFRTKWKYMVFGGLFLVICAIPASLSVPVPHTLRNHSSISLWSLASGWAVHRVFVIFRKLPLVSIGLVALIATEVIFFWWGYFSYYNQKSYADWNNGYKQAIAYLERNTTETESIYFTREYGRPITYLLFYLNVDPKLAQANSALADKDQQELLSFENIDFTPRKDAYDWRFESKPTTLEGYALFKVIKNPNQESVFYVYKKQ